MPEEAMMGREDAEGVTAVVHMVCFVMEPVGREEDVYAMTGGAMVFGVEVNDLICYEG